MAIHCWDHDSCQSGANMNEKDHKQCYRICKYCSILGFCWKQRLIEETRSRNKNS